VNGISEKELIAIHEAIISDTNIMEIFGMIMKIIQVEGNYY
jgi:hypothetical protein